MRPNTLMHISRSRRRGMSLVEVVVSVLVLTLLVGITIGIMSILTNLTRQTKDYTDLRIYQISRLAKIRDDLELSLEYKQNPITMIDYSERDENMKISATVDVIDTGATFGEELYLINMTLVKTDSGTTLNSQTLLRGGCVPHD